MLSELKTARSRRTRQALVAAVRARLAAEGRFTAEQVAREAGCTPGTFYAHFGEKDDAVRAAFEAALDDLVTLTGMLFLEGAGGLAAVGAADRASWAAQAVDRVLDYFTSHALLYRAALARLGAHRPLRVAYRDAERRVVAIVAAALGAGRPPDDAVAVVAFFQGLNNPSLLRTRPGDRVRRRLAQALATLAFESLVD